MARNEEVHLHYCKCVGCAKQLETLRKEFLNSLLSDTSCCTSCLIFCRGFNPNRCSCNATRAPRIRDSALCWSFATECKQTLQLLLSLLLLLLLQRHNSLQQANITSREKLALHINVLKAPYSQLHFSPSSPVEQLCGINCPKMEVDAQKSVPLFTACNKSSGFEPAARTLLAWGNYYKSITVQRYTKPKGASIAALLDITEG